MGVFEPKDAMLTFNNQTCLYCAAQILVSNGTHHAGREIRTHDDLKPGTCAIIIFDQKNKYRYAYDFAKFMLGLPAKYTVHHASEFVVSFAKETTAELDGEALQAKLFTFSVKPHCLRVVRYD
jgi:diacylglycerol kinase family enzyme